MNKKTNFRKVPGFMRTVLATNIEALMARDYKQSTLTARLKQLAKDATVSYSTIQRVMASDTGASLDTIELIASVFHLSAYQILIPNLHVNNPQVIKGATKDEERLYSNYRRNKLKQSHETEAT